MYPFSHPPAGLKIALSNRPRPKWGAFLVKAPSQPAGGWMLICFISMTQRLALQWPWSLG